MFRNNQWVSGADDPNRTVDMGWSQVEPGVWLDCFGCFQIRQEGLSYLAFDGASLVYQGGLAACQIALERRFAEG